ncbi:MAG: glycyl-radical enzyme activating protein [Bacteroidales bacterium]|nr:glycyl-radical enzyme activating protein [Bacteroidales bacterium]
MEGIIFDIRRFAVHDGPGIRTTVFFKGCPLSCQWCHNPESIDARPVRFIKKIKVDDEWFDREEMAGKPYTVNDVLSAVIRDKVFYEESGGGVTFSGGEPMLQPEFLEAVLKACHDEGLHTAVDTCGHVHQNYFDRIFPFTDLFLFDLKHLDPVKHKQSTGYSNDIIIENLKYVLKAAKPLHIRIPVIPSFNFRENDLIEIMQFLKSLHGKIEQVDLLPYHTLGNNKYKRFAIPNPLEGIPALKKDDVLPYVEAFKSSGFNVTIGG